MVLEYRIPVSTRVGSAISDRTLVVPSVGGMLLTSDPGRDNGLSWLPVESIMPAPSQPTVQAPTITVTADSSSTLNLTTALRGALSGVLNFSGDTQPQLRAVVGESVLLHFDGLSGRMAGPDFETGVLLPAELRPYAPVHALTTMYNGAVKVAGLVMISVEGKLMAWPMMTKNDDAWVPDSSIYIDSFAISFVRS